MNLQIQQLLQSVLDRVNAIETKLDILIGTLAGEDEPDPELEDLEGESFGGQRNPKEGL